MPDSIHDLHFMAGGGESGDLIRSLDWDSNPLGRPRDWPEALKTLVGVMLTSNQPMLIVWGPEFTTLYNDGYAAMCGDRHPAALGHGFDALWFDIWDQVEPILAKAYAGISTQMDDIMFVMHRNGYPEETHFAFSYTPVRTDDGVVAGMFCACTETTKAVLAQRRLDKERDRQRLHMMQMPGFVAVLDGPAHVFEYVNDAYRTISGPRDFIGRTVREVFPELAGQGFYERLDRVYATGEPFRAEGIPITLQGERDSRHIDLLYQPIFGDDGEVSGIFVGGYDVTSRILAEGALRQLTDTLEARVAEQAEALRHSEAVLRQSQKMEAVGQLTGGLAHDFNNLLAGISGSLDMMQTRLAQGRVAEIDRYMIGAQGAAKRAAALTHRLLAFSRRQTLSPKPTDVNRLAVEMEDLIRRTVGPAIQVETIVQGGLWPTLVDPPQLENALLNLCINARDAMPDGGRITIETANRWLDERSARQRDLPAGQYVSMCVSDTGTGMSADIIEKAFDPFFTTKPIGVGTGLGLSMIYGFARQSGGQVRIYSEIGQGTMVCIYLPRHHTQEEPLPEPVSVPIEPAQTGETVLVIDDEPLVRMLVVDVLEDMGYLALEAGDGPQGMKIIRSDARIDLLITDVGLPNGMNGRQVADAAREVRPDLKVLFVTGYAENAVLSRGHLAPGMQVVTKPFDMNDLGKRIKTILDG